MDEKKKTVVMVGVMLGMFASSLNQTLIGTAMPQIVSHMGGMVLYSWVFTSYMLISTTAVPIFGKLSDIYGRRPFYILGLVIFMAGSALGGFSGEMWGLIVCRGIQGLGVGMLMANSMAVVGDVFPPAERGRWQGALGSVYGLSSIIGPALGGYITDNLNWRWVFFVNLPVGLLAFALLYVTLPKAGKLKKRPQIDYAGLVTLIAAVIPLLLALTWGGKDYMWGSHRIVGLLSLSAVSAVSFFFAESHAREPILPLSLFKNKIFTISSAIVFLTGIGMFGTIMYIPLFVQGVIGGSATASGLVLMPMMISTVLASVLTGHIVTWTGRYKIAALAGILTMTAGMYLLSAMNVSTTNTGAGINMIVTGSGLGVIMPLFVIVVQNTFSHKQLGVVTATVPFFRGIGGILGVAVMNTLMNNTFSRELNSTVPAGLRQQVPADVLNVLLDPQVLINREALGRIRGGLPPVLDLEIDKIVAGVKSALALAIHDIFLFGLIALILSLALAPFIKEIALKNSNE
ncbi:MAG: MFS transporter [Firmicutes bacterium]|nr:MFS transporter [Bacillota bacterium]